MMLITGSVISLLLIILLVVGAILSIKAVITARRPHIVSRPIRREMLIFTPRIWVIVEFAGAAFGFPGLGWILSGKIIIGIGLISIVPSVVWALLPAYAIFSGLLANDPFATVKYLPVLATISAGLLALVQTVSARSIRRRIG